MRVRKREKSERGRESGADSLPSLPPIIRESRAEEGGAEAPCL